MAMRYSWLHARAEARPAGAKGQGIFATGAIASGTIVTAFGGHMLDGADFARLPIEHQTHSLQVADDLFLACPAAAEDADLFNHSCDPNLGISGSVMLATTRDVAMGEELTFDYAMCDADDYDEFECECGTASCRRKVTGNDWMSPEVQSRYAGHFSTYLETRIATLHTSATSDSL